MCFYTLMELFQCWYITKMTFYFVIYFLIPQLGTLYSRILNFDFPCKRTFHSHKQSYKVIHSQTKFYQGIQSQTKLSIPCQSVNKGAFELLTQLKKCRTADVVRSVWFIFQVILFCFSAGDAQRAGHDSMLILCVCLCLR